MFERRGSFRKPACIPAKLRFDPDGAEYDCLIIDISEEGAAVELELLDPPPGVVPKQITLKPVTGEVLTGTRIWGEGKRIGFKLSGATRLGDTWMTTASG